MAIIISTGGKNARKLEESGVENEAFLQRYVSDNPDSLPFDQIKEGVRLLIVGREFPTTSGPIDVLALDREGDVYIIETKLFQNPDKRHVVAQVLDYGAALWTELGSDDFIRAMDDVVARQDGTSVRQRMIAMYGSSDDEASVALEAVKANLRDGNFKFVVLMDHLHPKLKRLLQFLNAKSRFTLFAVEMEFYRHDSLEIIIPRVYGAEAIKETSSARTPAKSKGWNEMNYFQDVEGRLKGEQAAAVRHLFDFSARTADEWYWGKGTNRGSFNPRYWGLGPYSLYTVYSDGTITINFKTMAADGPDRTFKRQFKESLDRTGFGPLPDDFENRYVDIPVETWSPRVDALEEIIVDLHRRAARQTETMVRPAQKSEAASPHLVSGPNRGGFHGYRQPRNNAG
jgi:hypothetical protein